MATKCVYYLPEGLDRVLDSSQSPGNNVTFGQAIVTAALFDADAIFGEISRDLIRTKRIVLPYLRNDDPYFTHRELERILYSKPAAE